MNQETKNTFIQKALLHVTHIQCEVTKAIEKITVLIDTKMGAAKIEDKWTNAQVKAMNIHRREQLTEITTSPYFSKCEITFDDSKERRELYFGKFQLTEEHIYSWIAPAGSIRFENPGPFSYKLPNGKLRTGVLHTKDQYMIIDGKVVFYSKEGTDLPRELIYQEHFSKHKAGFVLPEIVSQMEKAQDTIIRAHYKGPFVISGPAGSGKTTLALHRIAYLMQAQDTAELYPAYSILVLVQDESTKDYFSHLLPSLGIHHVQITTFAEWAATIIGLEDCTYQSQFIEDDFYEYKKLQALRSTAIPKYSKNIFSLLQKVYSTHFSEKDIENFAEQKNKRILDRIDMTLLLLSYKQTFKKLSTVRTYYGVNGNGDLVLRKATTALEYSLIAIDEFQNYLPEQLTLFKQCILDETESLVYIGDMKQQVRVGTIQNWSQIQEHVVESRNISLNKVYRNTQQIIEYIKSKGFDIEVPEGTKSGVEVKEHDVKTNDEALSCIITQLKQSPNEESFGCITSSEEEIPFWKNALSQYSNIHVLSMRQSQGLEFDRVCIIKSTVAKNDEDIQDDTFVTEKQKIEKDLLYVALTRAITELMVIHINS